MPKSKEIQTRQENMLAMTSSISKKRYTAIQINEVVETHYAQSLLNHAARLQKQEMEIRTHITNQSVKDNYIMFATISYCNQESSYAKIVERARNGVTKNEMTAMIEDYNSERILITPFVSAIPELNELVSFCEASNFTDVE